MLESGGKVFVGVMVWVGNNVKVGEGITVDVRVWVSAGGSSWGCSIAGVVGGPGLGLAVRKGVDRTN